MVVPAVARRGPCSGLTHARLSVSKQLSATALAQPFARGRIRLVNPACAKQARNAPRLFEPLTPSCSRESPCSLLGSRFSPRVRRYERLQLLVAGSRCDVAGSSCGRTAAVLTLAEGPLFQGKVTQYVESLNRPRLTAACYTPHPRMLWLNDFLVRKLLLNKSSNLT